MKTMVTKLRPLEGPSLVGRGEQNLLDFPSSICLEISLSQIRPHTLRVTMLTRTEWRTSEQTNHKCHIIRSVVHKARRMTVRWPPCLMCPVIRRSTIKLAWNTHLMYMQIELPVMRRYQLRLSQHSDCFSCKQQFESDWWLCGAYDPTLQLSWNRIALN